MPNFFFKIDLGSSTPSTRNKKAHRNAQFTMSSSAWLAIVVLLLTEHRAVHEMALPFALLRFAKNGIGISFCAFVKVGLQLTDDWRAFSISLDLLMFEWFGGCWNKHENRQLDWRHKRRKLEFLWIWRERMWSEPNWARESFVTKQFEDCLYDFFLLTKDPCLKALFQWLLVFLRLFLCCSAAHFSGQLNVAWWCCCCCHHSLIQLQLLLKWLAEWQATLLWIVLFSATAVVTGVIVVVVNALILHNLVPSCHLILDHLSFSMFSQVPTFLQCNTCDCHLFLLILRVMTMTDAHATCTCTAFLVSLQWVPTVLLLVVQSCDKQWTSIEFVVLLCCRHWQLYDTKISFIVTCDDESLTSRCWRCNAHRLVFVLWHKSTLTSLKRSFTNTTKSSYVWWNSMFLIFRWIRCSGCLPLVKSYFPFRSLSILPYESDHNSMVVESTSNMVDFLYICLSHVNNTTQAACTVAEGAVEGGATLFLSLINSILKFAGQGLFGTIDFKFDWASHKTTHSCSVDLIVQQL